MDKKINHIWIEHSNKLLYFISNRVNSTQVAEDLLQDVFLKILSKIDTLKDEEKLQSWLYQITRNVIADYYRGKEKENKLSKNIPFQETEEGNPNAMKEAESWIGLYVNDLPETYREAVILSELKGQSIGQVAEELGISYTNARARISRGRQMLKKNLTDCCTFHVDAYGNVIEYKKNPPHCKNC